MRSESFRPRPRPDGEPAAKLRCPRREVREPAAAAAVRRAVPVVTDPENEPDIEIVGEAGTAAQALARVPACRELCSERPELACPMLTSFADDDALLDAILAGAAGCVLKQIRGADLVGAIRTVSASGSLLDR